MALKAGRVGVNPSEVDSNGNIIDGGGGGGTSNYNELSNKPKINSVELKGSKSLADLGIQKTLIAGDGITLESDGTISGVNDYEDLLNTPSINGVSLIGDKSTEDLIPIGEGLGFDVDGSLMVTLSNEAGGGGFAPIGTIIAFMGTTAPQDYLACDGDTYDIADYPQLADFIETQFGSVNYFGGNGTTTFGVPDLQGEFLRGKGTNSHANQGSGANVGVHQNATEVPWVALNMAGNTLNARQKNTTDGNAPVNMDYQINKTTNMKGVVTSTGTSSESVAERYAVRPTNTSVLFCIKAVVAGEVYSTEERVVGTWIDGKKVYEKTISCGALPNNTTKNISHLISNMGKVISMQGVTKSPTITMSMPHCATNVANNIVLSVTDTQINIQTASDRTAFTESYVTLRYTKTTD